MRFFTTHHVTSLDWTGLDWTGLNGMAPYTLSRSQADYFLTGLTSDPPVRHDGRQLLHFRPVEVEAGVAPHSNGSASVNLGGTSVLCAITAEVTTFSEDSDDEDDDDDNGDGQVPSSRNRGKIVASVECSQALQHTFDSRHLETISTTLTALLTSLFSSAKSSPIPLAQLIVIPNAKRWTVTVQVHIDSLSGGNAYDAVFAAVFSALYDTRIPLTRGVAFQAPVTDQAAGGQGAFENAQGDLDQLGIKGLVKSKSKFAKGTAYANAGAGANQSKIVDFELENNYDDGYPLAGREDVPVCVTVNIVSLSLFLSLPWSGTDTLRTCPRSCLKRSSSIRHWTKRPVFPQGSM